MEAELIANGLKMEYPDIYRRLMIKISVMVPVVDTTSDIDEVICRYCDLNRIGTEHLRSSSDHRKRLLAVCMRYFHPEKLYGYTHKRLRNGIISAISEYSGCNKSVLQNWVSEIITHYRVYDDFKQEIDDLFVTIKIL